MNVLVVMMKGVKPGVVTYEALIDENGLVIQVNKAKDIFYASVRRRVTFNIRHDYLLSHRKYYLFHEKWQTLLVMIIF